MATNPKYEAATLRYKAATVLMFLLAHDEDQADRLQLDLSVVNKDVNGTLSIEGQRITVTLDNGLTFISKNKYDYYTLQIPPVKDEPGILYRRDTDHPKLDEIDNFFIAQYPTFFGERGRIVIDLWIDNEIVGVFKTNSSNFGAGGSGEWRGTINKVA